jgi:primosomal protein N' (replication factor Y)
MPAIGARVRVPFGSRTLIGVVVEGLEEPTGLLAKAAKLRPLTELIDGEPLLPDELFGLLLWAARYYHHPIGEVFDAALPGLIRRGEPPERFEPVYWRVTDAAATTDKRAPRQQAALQLLQSRGGTASAAALAEAGYERRTIRALHDKGYIDQVPAPTGVLDGEAVTIVLNEEQQRACDAICEDLARFSCVLLDGVTGSGKTEVYLRCIDAALRGGGQALVLIPEIGLTPQTLARFAARFGSVEAYHSGLSELRRAEVWQACRTGRARVLIGTRSAIFVPFQRLALVVVDEEHDGSFKQQDGFRYSARDLAVKRCQQLSIPLVLGSATPSLESLRNAGLDRYRHLPLTRRAGIAEVPKTRIVDLRGARLRDGLSEELIRAIQEQVGAGNQVLVYINRRGFSPAYLCTGCGWNAECPRCDRRATLHQRPPGLRCHHCGWRAPLPHTCPACGRAELLPVGTGTQRGETALVELLPNVDVLRIDRDVSRSGARLETQLERIQTGEPAVLVGTQMLAKGHHFPAVTLVAVVNADAGLFSADFKAPEHTAQLIVQVAGRAGRAERPGEVWIQTYNPDNPLLKTLVENGYPGFVRTELAAREQAALPPYRAMALIRAEALSVDAARQCLNELTEPLRGQPDLELWGPIAAPMARRADRHRMQSVVIGDRGALHRGLTRALSSVGDRRFAGVRWSVDVDPYDMI